MSQPLSPTILGSRVRNPRHKIMQSWRQHHSSDGKDTKYLPLLLPGHDFKPDPASFCERCRWAERRKVTSRLLVFPWRWSKKVLWLVYTVSHCRGPKAEPGRYSSLRAHLMSLNIDAYWRGVNLLKEWFILGERVGSGVSDKGRQKRMFILYLCQGTDISSTEVDTFGGLGIISAEVTELQLHE